jgi:uncharacterized damage-inducible protein DinB
MDKATLQHDLFENRRAVLALLRGLPEDAATAAPPAGTPSLRDIAAHLVAWEDRLLTIAQKVLWGDGDKVDWLESATEVDAWNARAHARLAGWTWAEVLRALALQREETDWNVTYLPESQIDTAYRHGDSVVTVGELLYRIAEHDREHLPDLEATRAAVT